MLFYVFYHKFTIFFFISLGAGCLRFSRYTNKQTNYFFSFVFCAFSMTQKLGILYKFIIVNFLFLFNYAFFVCLSLLNTVWASIKRYVLYLSLLIEVKFMCVCGILWTCSHVSRYVE